MHTILKNCLNAKIRTDRESSSSLESDSKIFLFDTTFLSKYAYAMVYRFLTISR